VNRVEILVGCKLGKLYENYLIFVWQHGTLTLPETEHRKWMTGPKRAAIYLRTSTTGQHTDNQRLELVKIAERRGWVVVEVYEDFGISGAKGRDKRPALDQMLKDANRRRFDVALAWSIDRIGRSLTDLLATIQHLEAVGVDLYLDQQHIDTTTPTGRLLYQITGAFAEFERSMIRSRVNAGLARARAQGKRLGRRPVSADVVERIRSHLATGTGILKTAKALRVGTGTVHRVKREMAAAHP
jgi:DNA invertase Pin-like site-specific DNA recombinase